MNETSFYYGLLIGEIIWEKDLGKYTEFKLFETIATKEEIQEYERLEQLWWKTCNNDKTGKYINDEESFKEYRNYANSIAKKYFPEEVIYGKLFHFPIESEEDFKQGLENFLWNTDECYYSISEFLIEDLFRESKGLTIKFKLEYD